MSIMDARRAALAVVLVSLATSSSASAQAVDPAIYIAFDTSASMLYNPAGTASCHGDGSAEHPHSASCVSRLYMAKNALSTAIYGYPEARWGLARFKQQEASKIACVCEDQTDVAPSEEPDSCEAYSIPNENYDILGQVDRVCVNYRGAYRGYWGGSGLLACLSNLSCCDIATGTVDMNGADILVALADDNDTRILRWLDHQETDFRSGVDPTTGDHCYGSGTFGNCELRGSGFTPLAATLGDLYDQLSLVDIGDDAARACRQYAVVLLTDGDETCTTSGFPQYNPDYTAAPEAATDLRTTPDLQHTCTTNAQCPSGSTCTGGRCRYDVKTYVIAFGLASLTNASAIAAAGGTVAAIPANNENEITAAIAQIASEAVISEICNGVDDNCDGQADEGFPVGQSCNNGGQGVCYTAGTYVCDPADPTRVKCNYTTTPILPGTQAEICDGLDNDCDGEVDEGGICLCHGPELCNGADDYCDNWASHAEGSEDSRVNQICGTNVGACIAGVTQCGAGGSILCSGTGPVAEVCDNPASFADPANADQNCNGVNNDGVPPQPCTKTNTYGTCSGLEICNADGSWTCWAPTPAAEACNNVDDNCNGTTDENLFRACQVTNSFGTCHGTQACSAGAWGLCNAAEPKAETCNTLDDNCNGQVDENLSRACQVSNANGTCFGSELCVGGTYTGCTAKTPAAELCNNVDDDCDGQIDALSRSCYTGPIGTLGNGICHGGLQTCTAGTWSGCVGEQVPQAEICDLVDNDCDGFTDESLGTTTCGVGHCENTIQNCVSGVPQVCNPFLGAQPEACDNVDNDCDGVVDGITEACYPFSSGCTQTSPGVWSCNGACRTGLRTCPIGGGGWGACLSAAGPTTEVCDGVDNDCDGQTDENALGNPISVVCYSPGSGRGCTFDGNNWTCLGECQTGLRLCQGGVLGACQAEVVPSLELCDGVDNDCDGLTDEPEDIPNLGEACGTVLGRCTPGVWVCDGGMLDCQGGLGPYEGRCNGEDDDCDGQIDEADELHEDVLVGEQCGDATGLCEPGITQCLGGLILCVGGTGPSEEVCDGADNDCNDLTDEQVDCPPVGSIDTHCVRGACRPECDPTSEFPCPGTLQCQQHVVDGVEVSVCMPAEDPCDGACPPGWRCEIEEGVGVCKDPCDPNPCEAWETCNEGACLDTSCSGPGGSCPDGEFCWEHACEPDPCLTASCEALGGFCLRDCNESGCSVSCEPLCNCPVGERCLPDGKCAPLGCPEGCDPGERCNESTSACEADPCYGQTCDYGFRCFEGSCIEDPCRMAACPFFYRCELLPVSDGQGGLDPVPVCHADPRWWVEGTGVEDHTYTARGRGGCQAAGGGSQLGWALLLLGLLARRRRRGPMTRQTLGALMSLTVFVAVLAAPGCENNLFNVQSGDPGHYEFPDGGVWDTGTTDASVVPDACVPSDEICDGVDNDCNGVVDDAPASVVATDVRHCGACDHACDLPNAWPACVGGECQVENCFPGFWDLDGDPEHGCEYLCSVTNNGLEVCDGVDNDCDGVADEDFDLDTNPLHCGQCFRACNFFQAEGACVDGDCVLSSCEPGFADADQNADTGCECQLDVTEGTTTPCDPLATTPCGAGQVCVDTDENGTYHCAPVPLDGCDGRDNDCDGAVDEDAAAVFGGSQCYTRPLGCAETSPGVFTCVGQCAPGTVSCAGGQAVCTNDTGPTAEICDGVDNNCDGDTDEGYDTQVDPTHCGACGYTCSAHAGVNSLSVGCAAGICQYICRLGYVDLNADVWRGDLGNGCEYACSITNGGVETCGDNLDNDCDGFVDEGFDLQTDPQNCGACGTSCAANTPVGAEATGCVLGVCQYTCLPGFHDADNDLALGRAGNGCEYVCTTTNNGVEICDNLDNDCDGQIDEDFLKATNPLHCGACDYRCADHLGAHSVVAGCSGGVCQFSCVSGWVDVNGDRSLGNLGDGCEYACNPTNGGVEICDTLDNDCDGQIDEAPGGGPYTESCYSGPAGTLDKGICRAGTKTCTGGVLSACVGEVLPGLELCDGIDNDCDGTADDGIDTSTDLNNCGACGASCWANVGANAYPSACVGGLCQFTCLPGFSDLFPVDLPLGSAGNGCDYSCPVNPPAEEYCDGRDNDCDGQVDEALTVPIGLCYQGIDGPGPAPPGTDANNPCHGVVAVCQDPDGGGPLPHDWYCGYSSAVELNPTNPRMLLGYESLCDGKDGDCDGVPDDNFGLGRPCDDGGIGACRGSGSFQCTANHLASECVITSPGGAPQDEVCDGLDNDCDGLTDETRWENIPANDPSGVSRIYVVDDLVTVTTPSGVDTFVFQYEASHPTATYTDGGLGTSARACSRPDAIPWSYVTYQQAAEACSLAGMRLCRSDEWFEACNGSSGTLVYPYGSTYSANACNGHDMDSTQDAVEPTGTQANCDSQGYAIEDLSGNLREWTDDFVGLTDDARRVFRLRGGGFRDLSVGLRCDFTQSAFVEDSLAPHIGFRCCSTCGNGTIDPGETCDPVLTPATCHPAHCGPLTCGNGTTDAGEQCDDGNLFAGDGCSPACRIETLCGDGVREGDEDCDDGNFIAWDGCSPLCTTETTVLTEDFKPCPTATWTFVNGGAATTAWVCDKFTGVDMVIVIFQSTSGTQDGLITPVLNLGGYSAVQLAYTQYYNDPTVAAGDRGEVQYSLNGVAGPWTTLATQTASIGGTPVTLDVSATAGQANVAFRFYYVHSDGLNDYWAVRDVAIRAY